MDTKTFLDNFGHIADAPNGVAKLRDLVLQLAFQGKLTKQLQSEQTADELLDVLTKVKNTLIDNKIIKKTKNPPSITEEEIPYELPATWKWVWLSDIFDVRDGTHDSPKYLSEGYPLVTSKNLSSGKLDLTNVKHISETDHKKIIERSKVDLDDILFAMIGSIGNPVIVDIEPEFSIKNVALFKYYDRKLSNPRYLNYYLHFAAEKMREKAAGGVQSFVSLGFLRQYLFPLPPLEEQKRIVAKVDQLMVLCDQLETQQKQKAQTRVALNNAALDKLLTAKNPDEFNHNWKRIANNFYHLYDNLETLTNLRASILDLGVKGKLGTQDQSDEDVGLQIERIQDKLQGAEPKAKSKRKSHKSKEVESDPPYELPSSWKWSRFNKIATIKSNLVKPESYEDMPHIAPDVIEKGNGKLLPFRTIGEDGVKSPKHYFYPGQILYSKIRPNLSKLVTIDFEGLCSADMYPIEPHLDREYMKLFMLSEEFLKQVTSEDNRLAMPKVNQTQLNSVFVPVPPIEEQKRIVAKVDQLMAFCDQLETKLKQTQATSEKLVAATVNSLVAA